MLPPPPAKCSRGPPCGSRRNTPAWPEPCARWSTRSPRRGSDAQKLLICKPFPCSWRGDARRFLLSSRILPPASDPIVADTQDEAHPFEEAFGRAVDLGNQIADNDERADLWDIADGLL